MNLQGIGGDMAKFQKTDTRGFTLKVGHSTGKVKLDISEILSIN